MIKLSESFKDNIKKTLISPKTTKTLEIIGHTTAGGRLGAVIGTLYGGHIGKKTLKAADKLQKVNAQEFVTQHAPGVKFLTRETLKGNKDFNILQRMMLKGGLKKGNAFYIPANKKRNAYIAAAGDVPEPIISHEVGHHIDMSQGKKRFRTVVGREVAGWENAPVKNIEGFEKIRKGALRSYKSPVVGTGIGSIAGLITGLKKAKII